MHEETQNMAQESAMNTTRKCKLSVSSHKEVLPMRKRNFGSFLCKEVHNKVQNLSFFTRETRLLYGRQQQNTFKNEENRTNEARNLISQPHSGHQKCICEMQDLDPHIHFNMVII